MMRSCWISVLIVSACFLMISDCRLMVADSSSGSVDASSWDESSSSLFFWKFSASTLAAISSKTASLFTVVSSSSILLEDEDVESFSFTNVFSKFGETFSSIIEAMINTIWIQYFKQNVTFSTFFYKIVRPFTSAAKKFCQHQNLFLFFVRFE